MRILLIEDDIDMRTCLCSFLRHLDYECMPTNTEGATNVLRETPIDLILADVDQSSFHSVAAHALHHPNVPILAMRDDRDSDSFPLSPDIPYIGKPLSLPDLAAHLSRLSESCSQSELSGN